jgi:hypothetical protein
MAKAASLSKNVHWCALLAVLVGAGCSSSRMVQVSPRVDLASLGTIGMIEFRARGDDAAMSQQANRQFLSAIQAAQPGVPVLELGDEARVLSAMGSQELDAETVRAIGEKLEVDALIFGVLEAREVRPKVALGAGLSSLNARAEIEGTLTAKMYDTRTGATLWTCAATDRKTLAKLSVSSGGVSGGGTSDTDGVREKLLEELVVRATDDFRPGWIRVKE